MRVTPPSHSTASVPSTCTWRRQHRGLSAPGRPGCSRAGPGGGEEGAEQGPSPVLWGQVAMWSLAGLPGLPTRGIGQLPNSPQVGVPRGSPTAGVSSPPCPQALRGCRAPSLGPQSYHAHFSAPWAVGRCGVGPRRGHQGSLWSQHLHRAAWRHLQPWPQCLGSWARGTPPLWGPDRHLQPLRFTHSCPRSHPRCEAPLCCPSPGSPA